MIDRGKHSVLGVMIDAVDYETAVHDIVAAASESRPFALTALAVHGVMTGVLDPEHRSRLNRLNLVVPDGQPVRWALRFLYGITLPDRVYGPELTLRVCEAAAREGIGVYFYGSTPEVIERIRRNLSVMYPKLKIAGAEPSKFRRLLPEEKGALVSRIRSSGAEIVFIGLGCPRQEVWAYEYRTALSMPILAVGAAFDFIAGTKAQAPAWMQSRGMEWLFRLLHEPRRLA